MPGPLGRALHRRAGLSASLLASIVTIAGCGGAEEATLPADSPIGIQTTQLAVTIENRSGLPLVDLRVTVRASGLAFARTITRLENAERRDIRIDEFTSPDGTHLNLRSARPTTVGAEATDINGKAYAVETGWR